MAHHPPYPTRFASPCLSPRSVHQANSVRSSVALSCRIAFSISRVPISGLAVCFSYSSCCFLFFLFLVFPALYPDRCLSARLSFLLLLVHGVILIPRLFLLLLLLKYLLHVFLSAVGACSCLCVCMFSGVVSARTVLFLGKAVTLALFVTVLLALALSLTTDASFHARPPTTATGLFHGMCSFLCIASSVVNFRF